LGLPALLPGLPEFSLSLLLDRMDSISMAASRPMGMASQSTKKSRDLGRLALALARALR
jgi:hypothetical protein